MAIIGVDVGTSYTSVCMLNRAGFPERIKIATGTGMFGDAFSLPSAVYAEEDGTLLLGQSAVTNRMRSPERFKSEFKRDLGQSVPYLLGERSWLPEDLYKHFFLHVKERVEGYAGEAVTKTIVTHPAAYSHAKRELVRQAARRAGLPDVELLDEPSAAAMGYRSANRLKEGDSLLVYDLGGGTFDVALLRCSADGFSPIAAPQGLVDCGGIDFDKRIFDHMMAVIGEERLAPVKANPAFYRKFVLQMLENAIRAKHHLSTAQTFHDAIPVGYDIVEYTLGRDDYGRMIEPLVDETMRKVRVILDAAHMKPSEVDCVLLVGGASRTPMIRERLARLMGRIPWSDIDPETAICSGAAIAGRPAEQPVPYGPDTAWDEVEALCDGVRIVRLGELYGMIDDNGEVLARPQWTQVRTSCLQEDRLPVKSAKNGLWGFVGQRGDWCVPPEWEDVDTFSDGLAWVSRDGCMGFIDRNGVLAVPAVWDFCGSFQDGLSLVRKGGKIGYVDRMGQVVIPVEYESQSVPDGHIMKMRHGDETHVYETNGKRLS